MSFDEGIEKFRTSQIGKMDDVLSDFCHFAAHFFSGSQMQLDSFAGAALKETEDGGVWLQGGFFLS